MRWKTWHLLAAFALAGCALGVAAAEGAHGGERTPQPTIVIDKSSGQCVAPPAEMRRRHPEMLKHQRDRTLRQGVRGEPVSLNACIECHASRTTGSVIGSDQNFCQSCHSYVAVKLDCFECHQAAPRARVTSR